MMQLPKLFLLVIACSILIFLVLSQLDTHSSQRLRVQSRYEGPPFLKDKLSEIELEDNVDVKTWEKMQVSRVNSLQQQCETLEGQGYEFLKVKKSLLDHIVVNDKYKVMYCYVPKIACTNLKRIFLLLTGNMNTTDPLKLAAADVHAGLDKYLTYLSSYSVDEIQYKIQNYKKAIFVREPLERVLSAFRNKFLQRGNGYFKERFGVTIVKRYRQDASQRSLEKGDDVTFPEFVKYLLDPRTKRRDLNEHWAPISDLCHPCHLNYDFIGKYESIEEDVDKLLQHLSVGDMIQFPERGDSYKTLKTEDILGKFYKNLTTYEFRELQKLYAQDFQVFQYDSPKNLEKLFKYS